MDKTYSRRDFFRKIAGSAMGVTALYAGLPKLLNVAYPQEELNINKDVKFVAEWVKSNPDSTDRVPVYEKFTLQFGQKPSGYRNTYLKKFKIGEETIEVKYEDFDSESDISSSDGIVSKNDALEIRVLGRDYKSFKDRNLNGYIREDGSGLLEHDTAIGVDRVYGTTQREWNREERKRVHVTYMELIRLIKSYITKTKIKKFHRDMRVSEANSLTGHGEIF